MPDHLRHTHRVNWHKPHLQLWRGQWLCIAPLLLQTEHLVAGPQYGIGLGPVDAFRRYLAVNLLAMTINGERVIL